MTDRYKTQWRLEYERMARALADIAERADEIVTDAIHRPDEKGNHILGLEAIAKNAIKDLSLGDLFVWQGHPEPVPSVGDGADAVR